MGVVGHVLVRSVAGCNDKALQRDPVAVSLDPHRCHEVGRLASVRRQCSQLCVEQRSFEFDEQREILSSGGGRQAAFEDVELCVHILESSTVLVDACVVQQIRRIGIEAPYSGVDPT